MATRDDSSYLFSFFIRSIFDTLDTFFKSFPSQSLRRNRVAVDESGKLAPGNSKQNSANNSSGTNMMIIILSVLLLPRRLTPREKLRPVVATTLFPILFFPFLSLLLLLL